VDLDPLVDANDTSKPLISKLLAVPSLRTRYLQHVRELALVWLDWKTLGPLAQKYQNVIAEDVKKDTRKLYSTEAFLNGLEGGAKAAAGESAGRAEASLKEFAEKRQAYLLSIPEIKKLSE
jgi:hypothetical protein